MTVNDRVKIHIKATQCSMSARTAGQPQALRPQGKRKTRKMGENCQTRIYISELSKTYNMGRPLRRWSNHPTLTF